MSFTRASIAARASWTAWDTLENDASVQVVAQGHDVRPRAESTTLAQPRRAQHKLHVSLLVAHRKPGARREAAAVTPPLHEGD